MTSRFSLDQLSITQKISLSFLLVIIIGSVLLSLPIMHYADAPATSYWDHLFNTVSMVCVTGLSVFAVADVYNGLGQTLMLLLIQIGGLGLVSLIALSYYSLKGSISLSEQQLLQSSLSRDSHYGLKRYLFFVYKSTLVIELACALCLMVDLVPRLGWANGSFTSIFLAISAFCNAGFDNLGSSSLDAFRLNPLINLVITFLIVAGGLGFANWLDLITVGKAYLKKRPRTLKHISRQLSLQTKLVLKVSAIIIGLGTLLSWLLERDNPATIGQLPLAQQVMVSFFQTITMRTAGFATINFTQTKLATNLIYMIQMFIGGAPGGTAGGIKLVATSIVLLLFRAELKGQDQVTLNHRILPSKLIKQTLTVLIFYTVVLLTGYWLLLIVETSIPPFALLFETISALATVGVSMDVTTQLGTWGRLIIMILMFIGRVGPITVLLSLRQKPEKTINYARTNLMIG